MSEQTNATTKEATKEVTKEVTREMLDKLKHHIYVLEGGLSYAYDCFKKDHNDLGLLLHKLDLFMIAKEEYSSLLNDFIQGKEVK